MKDKVSRIFRCERTLMDRMDRAVKSDPSTQSWTGWVRLAILEKLGFSERIAPDINIDELMIKAKCFDMKIGSDNITGKLWLDTAKKELERELKRGAYANKK
jgi:hypothetical protein